jgi:hypothetical protein
MKKNLIFSHQNRKGCIRHTNAASTLVMSGGSSLQQCTNRGLCRVGPPQYWVFGSARHFRTNATFFCLWILNRFFHLKSQDLFFKRIYKYAPLYTKFTEIYSCQFRPPSPLWVYTEPVFVDLLWRPGIDSQPGGPVRNPICRTGPPGYIGWRNRFLGIDSWAP